MAKQRFNGPHIGAGRKGAGRRRLSLVCGLRPVEVRTLQWSRVNLPRRKMTVVGKTGAREVDLTDAASTILESTPRVQDCEFVFAGRRFGKPIAAVHKMLTAVQKRTDWRTMASCSIAAGAAPEARDLLGFERPALFRRALHATSAALWRWLSGSSRARLA